MGTEIRTDYLVLRKTAYGDTSMVVAGLTRDCGQAHFLVRGGRKVTRKATPVVDLFRVLAVVYVPGRSDLMNWRQADPVRDYGGLAGDLRLYQVACWLARFALANTCNDMECLELFSAMCTGLGHLRDAAHSQKAIPGLPEAVKCGVCLAYLSENGLLPSYRHGSAESGRLDLLLRSARGLIAPPDLGQSTWQELLEWATGLLLTADCKLP